MSSDSYKQDSTLAKEMSVLFGKRVRALREERGFSLRKLGQRIGCSGQTIYDWESGRIDPNRISRNYLDAAASILGTSVEYLVTGRSDTPPKVRLTVQPVREIVDEAEVDGGILLSVCDMDVRVGPDARMIPEFVETSQRLHFTRGFLEQMGITPDDVRVVSVRGDSMQPTLWDKDCAMIDLRKTRVRNDHVFALAYGGEARFKRLQILADGTLRIISDHPDKLRFPDEFIAPEELANVVIIGQVIHKSGRGGL